MKARARTRRETENCAKRRTSRPARAARQAPGSAGARLARGLSRNQPAAAEGDTPEQAEVRLKLSKMKMKDLKDISQAICL